MPHALFSILTTGVDEAAGLLRGAIVASKGEAKGHGLFVGDRFLDALAKFTSLPFRVDPPADDVHGGALAIEGEATNFRRDGDDVRADIQLFDLPGGKRAQILKLSQSPAAKFIGLSLDLTYSVIGEVAGKLKEIIPQVIRSVDLVDQPAAARALFRAGAVDTPAPVSMNYTFLRQLCARFGIQFPATDAEVTNELASKAQTDCEAKLSAATTETNSLRTKLKELESRFCPDCGATSEGRCANCKAIVDARGNAARTYFQKKADGSFEEVKLSAILEDAQKKPAAASAVDEEAMADRIFTRLKTKGLAGIGGTPAPAAPVTDTPPSTGAVKLTSAVAKLATKLKAKPEDLQAKLAKHSPERQKMIVELGIDPDSFTDQAERFGKVTEQMPI